MTADSVQATATPVRRHTIPGVYNLRDTGGYRAAASVTRWGKLFRSDALHHIDEVGRDRLAELRIAHIIDLRGGDERTTSPNSIDGLHARVHHLPVLDEAAPAVQAGSRSGLAELYAHIVDERGAHLAAAIRVIAESDPEEAVLVHCAAGKDRTGLVVALALRAAGVERDEVVFDYAQTSDNLRGEWVRATFEHLTMSGYELTPELIELVTASPAPVMGALLDRVDREFGSAREYLRAHGLTPSELDRLSAALIS